VVKFAHASTPELTLGNGLGLAINKAIVERIIKNFIPMLGLRFVEFPIRRLFVL
jgi:hypothetical protein